METKTLSVGLLSLLLLGAPAAVAAGDATSSQQHTPAERNAHVIIDHSVNVIQRVKSNGKFEALMRRAKGVVVMPNVVKAAVGVGGSGGQGVLLAHRGSTWSDPAFVSMGSISAGPQASGKAGPVVMLLMTDKALNDFTQSNNFSLNANAGLTVVNYSAKSQGGFGKGDIIVWSGESGGFVGASISGTDFTSNSAENASFYGRQLTTSDIIKGHIHNSVANKLRQSLPA
jgi:lipid-binding SYLF domain-containing protein